MNAHGRHDARLGSLGEPPTTKRPDESARYEPRKIAAGCGALLGGLLEAPFGVAEALGGAASTALIGAICGWTNPALR